ncbi:unnamed protein product [Arctia plantaginis]|uniref:EGF-like domain-containing protein n=1 Tax=Arctia plantaginis TaxID=874455 RepID=A0A8S0Z235_ARCPL|nr:unnamed protein product [Arctia plantaginis]
MLVLILLLLNLSDDVFSLRRHHWWHPLPKCGPYEVASPCAITCPPQSCDSLFTDYYLCEEATHCSPGCNCIHNYLRNDHGVCIPMEQCFADLYHPGLHPRRNPMTWYRNWYQLIKSRLIDSLLVSYTDAESSLSSVSVSCYISHHTGPNSATMCNGDPNAMVFDCPSPCPPTCDQPDTSGLACIAMCDPSGCICKEGYILSKIGGQCVLPHECPGGAPKCSGNKTYVDCYIECTNRYCPGDYSDALVIYDPVYPCAPGCACKDGYLMLNSDDRRCVLAAECPPVQCTGPNEIWDPAPLNCNRRRCEDVNINTECIDLSTGTPQCVCKPGYYRDINNLCVPASECGKCNGDPNAISKQCVTSCAPTCADPDVSNKFCIEVCSTSGCECKPGYILSKIGGVCIEPASCPGGSPLCGGNKTYVDCFIGCPTNYCPTDDSRAMIACSIAFPCPPGCACNPGYMILSYEDQRCVKSSECPPVNCTRPNEVWDPAPSICYSESCEDTKSDCSDNPGPPRCVCQSGFYRNKDDICVPASECDTGCNGDPNAMRSACPSYCPPTCDEPSSFGKICIDACDPVGCVCKPGYILTKYPDGKCVKAEECPGGSPSCGENKTYVDCFVGCPTNYCPLDDSQAMIACDIAFPCPPGCACNPGYLMLSYEDQRCVKSSECPPINCTRLNEVWDPTPSNCYSESCEYMNSVCSDHYPGPPRCVCKSGFYRNKNDICVPASECGK